MGGWSEKAPEFVGARYDRLAPIYGLFEWLYGLPLVRIRVKSIDALELEPGDAVLEVGCGSGRNFQRIEERIGSAGALFGVDVSPRMLARAEALVRRAGWGNVTLRCADAASWSPPPALQAVLFCFSWSTMRDRVPILASAWRALGPGGRLVISDARLRPGWPRRTLGRVSAWMSDRTLLGRPDTDPDEELRALAGTVRQQHISFGPLGFEYVVCAATRPPAD